MQWAGINQDLVVSRSAFYAWDIIPFEHIRANGLYINTAGIQHRQIKDFYKTILDDLLVK